MELHLAGRIFKPRFIFMIKFLTKITLISVALWTCVITHRSVCSRIILNIKKLKIVRWSIKFKQTNSIWVKRTFHIISTNNPLNVWLIILGKIDWLNGWHSLWSLRCKFFRCVYGDFAWFHQPKTIFLIVLPTPSMGPFPWWFSL